MRKGVSGHHGYTIVEVMIFLAVSGVMFIMAAVFINGKEAQAQFTRSVGDVSSTLQQVLDNVINGYYPSQENFTCVGGSGALTFAALNASRGTNSGCVYIGEVIQFGVVPAVGSDGKGEQYAIIPTVGNRTYTSGGVTKEATDFTAVKPTPLTANATAGHADMVDNEQLLYDMHVTNMYKVTDNGPGHIAYTPVSAFGIFSTFGSYSNGLLQSGSQDVMVTTVPGMDYTRPGDYIKGKTLAQASDRIKLIDNSNILANNQSILICLKSGYDKPASISFGTDHSHLIFNTLTGTSIPGACTT